MPELPDIEVYVEALRTRVVGHELASISLRSPFVLRTVEPPYRALEGREVRSIERLAKRIVFGFEGDLFLAIHLMKLGRFRWADLGGKARNAAGKVLLAALRFGSGTLYLVEMGPKKRAALHVLAGREALAHLDPGGLEVLSADETAFAATLRQRNHTLKRALTDPTLLSGIGNAYSDEILWAAQLSPVKLSQKLEDDEMARLYTATRATLEDWTDRLRREAGDAFPEKVTAFREGMAVHGRYRQPCPRCGDEVQRIAYADRETNYCATCQTGGKPLADRALSRLLGKDWPKTMEELEDIRGGSR